MSKLLISDLHTVDLETFIEELKPKQVKTVLGGYIAGRIISIHDGINRVENAYEGPNSYNFRDNVVNSTDNSDQVYIWARPYL